MDELEELRRKKLTELQRQYERQQDEEQQFREQLAQLEARVKTRFTKEALARYGNIKAAHPDIAMKLLVVVGQALQQGKSIPLIDDNELKGLLARLQQNREFKIIRK